MEKNGIATFATVKRRQISILIGLSLAAVILLIAIQWYLVQRTFAFEHQQFEEELVTDVAKILEPYNKTEGKLDTIYTTLRTLVEAYKSRENYTGQTFIDETVATLRQADIFGNYVRQKLEQQGNDITFDHATVINYLGLNKNGQPANTFLFDTLILANKIEGSLTDLEEAFQVQSFTHSEKDFLIGLTLLVDVHEQQDIIWNRMLTVLILAGISIMAVIIIFLFTIRSLIRQKREADMQKDFINNITHEFKTPMATISLASKNLKNPKVQQSGDKINALSDLIERQNTRLQKLIDQAMNSSMADRGIILQTQPVNLHEFLANRIADFRIKLGDSDATITAEFFDGEPIIALDTFHFTTVIYNLFDNAIKYCETTPHIHVSSQLNDNRVSIKIQDNGIGIDLKNGQSIFEKFYRVPEGNLHHVKGLGLGLFYVKKIVEAHGAEIKVESKLGIGTNFELVFPGQ